MADAQSLWTACCDLLRPQVSDAVWRSTFHDARATTFVDGTLTVTVPNTLSRDRMSGPYQSLVTDALREIADRDIVLDLQVEPSSAEPDTLFDPFDALIGSAERTSDLPTPATGGGMRPGEPTGAAPHLGTAADDPVDEINPRYTFEAFVTGPSNRFAQAAALAVAETPGRSYNPLFIYGDAGLGKTHLLQAIAHYVSENYPSFTVQYVSTETFLNEFVDAIRTNSPADFKKRYREVDVLLLDDIQFIEGREGLQEELFHTFNALHQANRQIVLSSDRPPDAIPTLEDRLRSRFKMGLITEINPPELETRLAILHKKAETETVIPPADVFEFIATHITNNIRELEGALIRVCAYASLTKEVLSVDLAERVLSDILTDSQPRPITPTVILEATSEMFGFSIEEIQGKSRRRPLVTARQVGMYVFRNLTDLSYPAIAREFGGRDHTTVIHAVEKIGALMKERRQIYDQVTELTQIIRSGG